MARQRSRINQSQRHEREGRIRANLLCGENPTVGDQQRAPLPVGRTRIGRLSDFSFNGESENKDEIVRLGLTYNLLTAHTSFIAVSELRRNPGDSKDVDQPLPLPLHVSNLAVSGTVAVPEPELALLLVMAALVLSAGLFYKKWLRRRAVLRAGE
jgi:hypothetical protein